jgi:hypothetical protein
VYHGYWTGESVWRSATREPSSHLSLAQFCRDCSLPMVLITDDEETASHPLSAAFDDVIRIAPEEDLQQATDWQETWLARFFATAIEHITDRKPPALVWLQAAALGRIWDSPQSLRDRYSAEDDPPAADIVEPPSQKLAGDVDPDWLLGLCHAYAGEVTVLDNCIGALLDAMAASAWSETLLTVTSCRGYPLGEHGNVGRAAENLNAELLHVPWFVRVPGGPKYGARYQALVQPADQYATVCDWLAPADQSAKSEPAAWYTGRSLLRVEDDSSSRRKLAVARSMTGETALATRAWFVRAAASAEGEEGAARKFELYVKPDDRFEANEVSDRCLDIVDEFREVVQALEVGLEQGVAADLTVSDGLE